MSVVVVGAAIVTVGSTLGSMYMGGKGAQTQAEADEQKKLAEMAYQEDLFQLGKERDVASQGVTLQHTRAKQQYGLAGEQYGLAVEGIGISGKMAEGQYTSAMGDISSGAGIGMRNIQQSAPNTGFARSGTVEQQTATQKSDLWSKYKSDQQRIIEGKQFGAQQRGIGIQSAGLGYKAAGQEYAAAGKAAGLSREEIQNKFNRGEMSAEDAKLALEESIDAQPTGVWEGVFS